MNEKNSFGFLKSSTHYFFFTGKGGVGKTSLSAATAITLADQGKSVLLVSTDPASNLDEMLGVELRNTPVPVPGVKGLSVLNIDPTTAAESYRQRVLAQMEKSATPDERETVREQLSGACTTEIAAFDEFSDLLADDSAKFDHIIFDTAPTGHTIRLLSLPKAWTGFLKDNDRGASCLGPHSGLKMQETRFQKALATLSDRTKTTVVLVARPDKGSINEASKTSEDLKSLGLTNQRLAINTVFHAHDPQDQVASSLEALGKKVINEMPNNLRELPRDEIPLRPFNTVGLPSLRALLSDNPAPSPTISQISPTTNTFENLSALVDDLAQADNGLVMVMGKGGVGKTTVAAAVALGLLQRGKTVHLNTTDPAAHLAVTLNGELPGLQVDRIDPAEETKKYIAKVMAQKGKNLSQEEKDLLLEDLQSPCTEEVAVFHAFSRVVAEARNSFVVLDTAPTGHSLLLMDATGAYHRQITKELQGKVTTPLMRLQDGKYTKIILVALPEITPVSQAAALQEDLRRAGIEPYAWVINKSIATAGTRDPLLLNRVQGEQEQMQRVATGLAKRTYAVPWLTKPPIGIDELSQLAHTGPRK
jgi:arsenite/tail-anchored protein-transporting ATPase